MTLRYARRVLGVALLLVLVVTPIAYVVDYQFGGTYTEKVYPLVESNDWLAAATAQIPYDPAALEVDLQHAWSLVNDSDNASGLGAGSACWLWPIPTQTYGYVDSLMFQVLSAVNLYLASGGIFHNSTFTNWAEMTATMHLLGNSTGHIQQCFFVGTEATTLGLIVYSLSSFGLLVGWAAMPDDKDP